MEKKTINKAIEIKAGKGRVWEVLTEQPYLNIWTSAFMEGSVVRGEFKDGAQVIYSDGSGSGVAGKVTEYKPNESLKVSIVAEITNGEPDFNHPDSKRWEGAYDYYNITEKDGISTLTLESAFPAEFYSDFVPGWGKMLEKIKELAEK
jgi:uncharacterized protein YndB with AHSA1/START domain